MNKLTGSSFSHLISQFLDQNQERKAKLFWKPRDLFYNKEMEQRSCCSNSHSSNSNNLFPMSGHSPDVTMTFHAMLKQNKFRCALFQETVTFSWNCFRFMNFYPVKPKVTLQRGKEVSIRCKVSSCRERGNKLETTQPLGLVWHPGSNSMHCQLPTGCKTLSKVVTKIEVTQARSLS